MTTMKRLILAAAIAGVASLASMSANAFWGWGPFGMFPGGWDGPWGGGPWYGGGPYGYPYGVPYGGYGYPYGGYGAPYAWGAPYGWGLPAYGYPAYGYPAVTPAPAPSTASSDD